MNNKISKTLEFEKIKQQLQNFAATDQGIDKIQALRPEIDQEKVVALQNETEDGRIFFFFKQKTAYEIST